MTHIASTMLGPPGVSLEIDSHNPAKTLTAAIKAASNAILSGVVAKGRAATAGTIKNAITSRMPTIFMATAMTTAKRMSNTARGKRGSTPSAAARLPIRGGPPP